MTAKERQLLFLLVRQLSEAQFVRADHLRSDRLWQEVGALGFDPDLVLSLLYGGHDPTEPGVLDDLVAGLQAQGAAAGPRQARRPTGFRWGWGLSRRRPAAAHRSAPPAATPTRQGVR